VTTSSRRHPITRDLLDLVDYAHHRLLSRGTAQELDRHVGDIAPSRKPLRKLTGRLALRDDLAEKGADRSGQGRCQRQDASGDR
jgi:hypothetical protein